MYVLENEPSFQGKYSSTLIKAQVSIFLDMYPILSSLGAPRSHTIIFFLKDITSSSSTMGDIEPEVN